MTAIETWESATRLRIAVLGAGKMGGILVQAFLRSGLFPPEHVVATVAHEARATALTKQFGIPPGKVHDHLLGRPALMNCEFCGTDMEWHSRSARESRAAKCPACLHRSAGHCYCARCKAVVARKEASEEASRAAARKA